MVDVCTSISTLYIRRLITVEAFTSVMCGDGVYPAKVNFGIVMEYYRFLFSWCMFSDCWKTYMLVYGRN